jgi:hypothetical protein
VPGEIEPIEHNPVIRCQHCEDTRQYLDKDCFLAPLSAAGSSDKSDGTVAVVAGLIAAVKLARVGSIELQNRSLRVRSAIFDSITLARMVIEASKTRSSALLETCLRMVWTAHLCLTSICRPHSASILHWWS